MVERQTPYCAKGHDGIPMLMIKTAEDSDIFQCPMCGRRLKLTYVEDTLKIKELF